MSTENISQEEQQEAIVPQEEKVIVEKLTGIHISESDIKGDNKDFNAIPSMTLLVKSGAYVWKGEKIEVDEKQGAEIIQAELERLTKEREEFEAAKEDLERREVDLQIKLENFEAEKAAFETEKQEFEAAKKTTSSDKVENVKKKEKVK